MIFNLLAYLGPYKGTDLAGQCAEKRRRATKFRFWIGAQKTTEALALVEQNITATENWPPGLSAILVGPHIHKDLANDGFWNPRSLWPYNPNLGSLLCLLFGADVLVCTP